MEGGPSSSGEEQRDISRRKLSVARLFNNDSFRRDSKVSLMANLSYNNMETFLTENDLLGLEGYLGNKHVHVDACDDNGQTILMLAAQKGKLNFVQLLLSNGADVNATDNDDWSPLINAAKEGHVEVARELLDHGANLEQKELGGWTALMWACYKGRKNMVDLLLSRGADPNIQGQYHISCLMWAAGRGHSEIVRELICHGAKVNVGDKYGTTALLWAARKGYIEIVDDLLKAGANADTAGMYSWTPLIVATKGNFIDVVNILLEYKPNVNAVDKDDCTALTIACKEGYTEIAEALLKAGVYVNYTHKDRVGDSNLIHACKAGHIEVVEALIKKYADIDYQGSDKKTALYWAVEKGYADIVRILLKVNPDTELATKDGDTPLMKATRNRNSEIVQLLVDKKAKVSAVDKKGDTALHIAMRSRSKAIVEILLRNPKHSQLLYRPNKAGETPYNIDSCHQKNILGQIFGARRLNTNEDNENMLGYDLYSSALADFLSEPTLSMPICVGLYAKWGSGKSFLLNKLRDEMTNFAKQWVEPELEFSWLLFLLVVQFSGTIGFILGLALTNLIVGLSVAAGMFLILYILLIIVWFGVHHYDFKHAHTVSANLAKKISSVKLFIQVLFCHPSSTRRDDTTQANPIRFLFTEGTKVSSSGGDNSVAIIITSLFKACEKEYGAFTARLFTVFRPKLVSSSSWKWRHICCVPYFFIFYFIMMCLMAGILLMVLYNPFDEAKNPDTPIKIALIVIVTIIGITVIANVYTWLRMISALVFPAEKRLYRAIAHAEMAKSDDLQIQHSFVQLMSDMVLCMDAFTGTQTRLVIIVDGLDSCEQEKVLRNLDAVHLLFSNQNSPFITILAIDPHIIIKAIETNIHRLFQDISINGHDYLRNIVHLPFFLQNSALRKVKLAQSTSQSYKKNYWNNDDRGESFSVTTAGLGLNRRLSSESSMSIPDRFKQGALSRKSSKKLKASESIASSMGNLNRITGAHDLTKVLLTDDYFSDVNPRSMRRLMNVVYITGRLLKAFNVDFNWYHLASWVNITEQWPYRTSWIILFYEKNEDELEDNVSLKSIYDKIINQIPISKELEPLLAIDRDERKFEIFLSYHKASLQVIDLKMFLPFTINLDPYIRKVIKEDQQHMEEIMRFDTNVASGPSVASGTPNISQLASWSSFDNPAARRQLAHRGPVSRTPSFNQPMMMVPSAQSMLWGSNFISPTGLQSPCTGVTCPTPLRNTYSLPVDMLDTKLSKLTVEGVCNLLNSLEGLNKTKVEKYKAALIENNINGRVLVTCDLDELKKILGMVFGDWELFRMMLLNLREQEMQQGGSTHDFSKNVHFQQSGRSQTDQATSAAISESLASPRETVPPKKEFEKGPRERTGSMKRQQHTLEKQVTLEEQMIVGALQTLSEEAQEDVLEEQMMSMQEVLPSLPNPASCSTLSPIISDPDETMDMGSDVGSILSGAFMDNKEADILYIQTPPVSPGRQRYFSLGAGEDHYASKRIQVIAANANEMLPGISSSIHHRLSFTSATSSQASGINFLGTVDDENCITISCSPPNNLKYPKVHRPNKLHIEPASSFERLNKIKNKIINVISPPRSNTPSPNICKTKEKEPITAENIRRAKGDTSDDSTDNEQSESTPLVSPFRPPKIGSKDHHRSAFVTPPDRPHADTSIELSKDPSMSLDSLLVQRNSDKKNFNSFLGSTTLNPLTKPARHRLDEAYRATGSLDESQMKYPQSAGNVSVISPEYDLKGILVKGKSSSVCSESKIVPGGPEVISTETVL